MTFSDSGLCEVIDLFLKVRRMLATFRVFGRLLFLWDCALVFGDRTFAVCLLGVDPRIVFSWFRENGKF